MESAIIVQILDEAMGVSFCVNAPRKDINPTALPLQSGIGK